MQKASKDFNANSHHNTMLFIGKVSLLAEEYSLPEKAFRYMIRLLENSSTFKEPFQFYSFQKHH